MKTENHLQNKLQITSRLKIQENMQFLLYKNYILSVSHKRNTVDFYDIKTFRRKFYLKRKRHEKNFYHEKWKLIVTKEHKVFLLGYEKFNEEEAFQEVKADSTLDIYLLKIGQRKCIKKASFNYFKFIEDEKDDKLYIQTEYTIIQYDFISGTSNEKCCPVLLPPISTYRWVKFFLINNKFVIFYVQEVYKWIFLLCCNIMDKNLEFGIEYLDISNNFNHYYDLDSISSSRDSLVKISDNFFSLFSEEKDKTTKINFAELRMDDIIFNEVKMDEEFDIFIEKKNNLVDLILFNKKEINIKETGEKKIYPINKEKFGIVFNYRNYYICSISKMEIILQIDLKINEKLFLLKFKDDNNGKYKLYLNDKNNLYYIS